MYKAKSHAPKGSKTNPGRFGEHSKFKANVGVHPKAPATIETGIDSPIKGHKHPVVNYKMANLAWEPTKASGRSRFSATYLRDPKMRD